MPSHLPHFIQCNLIHATDLHISRKNRSTLAFLSNLQFYEVHNKQVLNYIDLGKTVLNKVQNKLHSKVHEFNGIQSQRSSILGSSLACPSYPVDEIIVGKYTYQYRDFKKVYILLKCWDLMVVIRRNSEGFTLQAEYEEVHLFKVHKLTCYQVQLSISFLCGKQDIVTNFQDDSQPASYLPKADVYRKILNTIKMKQSELLVHKTMTKKDFSKLKSSELFGCNFLRTPRLEEMQILCKCGDAWVKVTADDDIVIGVPLVNNSSTRLTTLRNLRAILQGCADLNYKFTLCQLNARFCDTEGIQTFFQSQNEKHHNSCSWSKCIDFNLRPEALCVLILRLKISELAQFDAVQLPLFAFYDIVISDRVFTQKCFVTTLSFRDIFTQEACRLNFKENHIHRDLLTVIATTFEANAFLEYHSSCSIFYDYLCSDMGFFRVSSSQSGYETMNVDGQDEDNDFTPEKVYFYNKNSDSLWHGTLLALTYISALCCEVRLYTKTHEKSLVFFRLLRMELSIKCGIKEIRHDARSLSAKLIGLEAALRDECCSYLEMCSRSAMKKERPDVRRKYTLQQELHLNELKTDLVFKDLVS